MKKLMGLLCSYKIFAPGLFFVTIGIMSIGFSWPIKIIFFIYSVFILWVLYDHVYDNSVLKQQEGDGKQTKRLAWLAIISFCAILFTRLLPFLRFGEAPLGYDTGFYIGAMKTLTYPNSITSASLYLLFTPFLSAGFSPAFLFHFFYVLFQIFLVGSFYFLLRSFQTPLRGRFAVFAVVLFSVSVVQFLGYWWAFAQQMLAMGFFLITLALFMRGSFLTILAGIITFLAHTTTGAALFVSFLFFYFFYFIQLFFKRRYYYARATQIFVVGLLFVPVAFFLKREDIFNIATDVWGQYGFLLKNIPLVWLSAFRGLFVVPTAFRLLEISILPFSIITVLYPSVWIRQRPDKAFFYRNLLIVYASLSALILLTFLPIIYQSRSSIILDLMLLVFAVPSILIFVEYFLRDLAGRILLSVFAVFFAWNIGLHVWQQGSMISPEEFDEIKTIPTLIEPMAGVLATDSLYAPWLWGFVGPNTVSPGYLGDNWSLETWNRFWGGDSDEERLQLLQKREHPQPPTYIYIGERQKHGLPFEKFIRTAPQFKQITPHLWKLVDDPRIQPKEPIPIIKNLITE